MYIYVYMYMYMSRASHHDVTSGAQGTHKIKYSVGSEVIE